MIQTNILSCIPNTCNLNYLHPLSIHMHDMRIDVSWTHLLKRCIFLNDTWNSQTVQQHSCLGDFVKLYKRDENCDITSQAGQTNRCRYSSSWYGWLYKALGIWGLLHFRILHKTNLTVTTSSLVCVLNPLLMSVILGLPGTSTLKLHEMSLG